jgi:hypothetical protein
MFFFSFPDLQATKFILADPKDCVADMLELMTGGLIKLWNLILLLEAILSYRKLQK